MHLAKKRGLPFLFGVPQTPRMSDELLRGAPTTLTSVLDRWRADHLGHDAVADVVAAIAGAGARVATVIAASPLVSSSDATEAPATNVNDDAHETLDVQVEGLFVAALSDCNVAAVCSEETTEAIRVRAGGGLVVTLDPIDGSSNIDINAPVGSIFGVLPTTGFVDDSVGELLQPGRNQLAAGIINYGPSTMIALTWGEGTDIYALHAPTGTFILAHPRIKIPADAQEYAINASNARHWGPSIRAYVNDLVNGSLGPREHDFDMRWLASLVAETYRILRRGGIFLDPSDERPGYQHGHVRLVHEANPVAFLCEQAGGAATDGVTPILDLQPTDQHHCTPFVFGSRNKVERVRRYLLDPQTTHEESPLFSQRGLFRS